MKNEIELAEDYCPRDCVYLAYIDASIPCCYYCGLMEEPRRCKISECDKYRKGEKLQPRLTHDLVVYWERGVYDQDVDAFWARYIGTEL